MNFQVFSPNNYMPMRFFEEIDGERRCGRCWIPLRAMADSEMHVPMVERGSGAVHGKGGAGGWSCIVSSMN